MSPLPLGLISCTMVSLALHGTPALASSGDDVLVFASGDPALAAVSHLITTYAMAISYEGAPIEHASRYTPRTRPTDPLQLAERELVWSPPVNPSPSELIASLTVALNAMDACDRFEVTERAPNAWIVRQVKHLSASGTCVDSPRLLDGVAFEGVPAPELRPWGIDPPSWHTARQKACSRCSWSVPIQGRYEGSATTMDGLFVEHDAAVLATTGRRSYWTVVASPFGTMVTVSGPRDPVATPLPPARRPAWVDASRRHAAGEIDDHQFRKAIEASRLADIDAALTAGRITPIQAANQRGDAREQRILDAHAEGYLTDAERDVQLREAKALFKAESRAALQLERAAPQLE